MARKALADWRRSVPLRRRALLETIRTATRAAKSADNGTRADLGRALGAARQDYREWLAHVAAERTRRRAELTELRRQASDWRQGSRTRRGKLAELTRSRLDLDRDELEGQLDREADSLLAGVASAKRALHRERLDQRARSKTARAATKRAPARKVTHAEWLGTIAANITDPLALAYWTHEKRAILARAAAKGVTEPDAVAEFATELAEADQDRAISFLVADSERLIRAETRKKAA